MKHDFLAKNERAEFQKHLKETNIKLQHDHLDKKAADNGKNPFKVRANSEMKTLNEKNGIQLRQTFNNSLQSASAKQSFVDDSQNDDQAVNDIRENKRLKF